MTAPRDGADRERTAPQAPDGPGVPPRSSSSPSSSSGSSSSDRAGVPPRSSSSDEASPVVRSVYRMLSVWRRLPSERRLAAGAAAGLFVSLFLPWYQETVIARGMTGLRSVSASLTGWQAFSFVEAAVLLVAAAVLFLLFVRAEGQAFHVPGGDGGVITAAGLWTCVLIVWRMFDKEGTAGHGQYATTSGIEWGIFVALGVAALLAYAGSQIRLAHEPEPPLVGERPAPPVRSTGIAGMGRQTAGSPAALHDSASSAPTPAPAPSAAQEPAADQTKRRRPRSIAGERPSPAGERSAPTAGERSSPAVDDDDDPTVVSDRRPRPTAPPDPSESPTHKLDRDEIASLNISEPPTARLGRRRSARPASDPDDQLTMPLERPE